MLQTVIETATLLLIAGGWYRLYQQGADLQRCVQALSVRPVDPPRVLPQPGGPAKPPRPLQTLVLLDVHERAVAAELTAERVPHGLTHEGQNYTRVRDDGARHLYRADA